jgi:uncharacterized protein
MEMALDDKDKKRLLDLARKAVEDRLLDREPSPPDPADQRLGADQGAFVTLHHRSSLRGCIGNFTGQGSLAETIRQMAGAAAFEDPRFPPLSSPKELDRCDFEISSLTPLVETAPEKVEVGRHGIYIINGFNRGVLLPQVATEQGWDRETFLDQTCVKAGLSPGCWRDSETKVMTFEAEVFGEKDLDS